ncbi:MAG: DUF454 domain-containing protein [Candidatus Aminicenantes bacterium]|nr:DUF454 domain-containing protein [Candidatus Aminicenantes bacterium]
MKGLTRALLIAAGTFFVGLGVLGMFLPVLPTTPFLLLAAWCFARSSKRFYDRLLNNRLSGPYIRNYRDGVGISRRRKALSLAMLWLTIGASALFFVTPWWGKAALFAVAAGVTVHLLMMKTFKARPTEAAARQGRGAEGPPSEGGL